MTVLDAKPAEITGEGRALVARPSGPMDAYEPHGPDEGMRLAAWLVKSGFLGSAIKTPEQALAIMVAGKELGVRSMQALRSIHLIDGKPTLSADLMLALCKRSPDCTYFVCTYSDDKKAAYKTQRRGDPEPIAYVYTGEMAQRAQLTEKANYKKMPEPMLRALHHRARAHGVSRPVHGRL